MKRTTRNRILIGVIMAGLANFAAYTFFYWVLQGDACNGFIRFEGSTASTEPVATYYLRGHFIQVRDGVTTAPVSRATWIYSYVHSISIWPTIAAVLIAMFVLARPHILATLRSDSLISARVVVNLGMALVVLVTVGQMVVFTINLAQALRAVADGRNYGI